MACKDGGEHKATSKDANGVPCCTACGKPLFERIVFGDGTVTVGENPYATESWHVRGQKDNGLPYVEPSRSSAIKLAATVEHYNKTGERKRFTLKQATALIARTELHEVA